MRKRKLGDFKSHNKLFVEGRLEPLSAAAQLTDFLDQAVCPRTLTLYHMKVSECQRRGPFVNCKGLWAKEKGAKEKEPKPASSQFRLPLLLAAPASLFRAWRAKYECRVMACQGLWTLEMVTVGLGLSMEKWRLRAGGCGVGLELAVTVRL